MITNFAANKILNNLAGNASLTSIITSSAWIGLSSTAPNATGTNVTEPTGNGYQRTLLGNTQQSLSQKMGTASAGVITNEEEIHFKEATGAWGTLTHFCIFDAQTSGNLIAYGVLASPISPAASSVPLIRVGELELSFS